MRNAASTAMPMDGTEQLYVGLSPARSLLVVVGDSCLLEEAGGRELKVALSRTQAWRPPDLIGE